jgi:hypothetical protein
VALGDRGRPLEKCPITRTGFLLEGAVPDHRAVTLQLSSTIHAMDRRTGAEADFRA